MSKRIATAEYDRCASPLADGSEQRRSAIVARDDGGLPHLLERNRAWAETRAQDDPSFFTRPGGRQRPRYFWIGCSDCLVPAAEIVDVDPAEVFVHRNLANLAAAGDPNFSAALKFAVDILEVRHVIVAGHHGCGGIQAAMDNEADDVIGRWLAPVRMLHHQLSIGGRHHSADVDLLCEHNVARQVRVLTHNPIIRTVWRRNRPLTIHGWVYAAGDGLLHAACRPVRNAPPLRPRKVQWPGMS